MKRSLLLVLLPVGLAAAGCSGQKTDKPADLVADAVVARIADGDTLELESGKRVRLLQVDAPELGEGECYSKAAQATLERIAPPGTSVRLEADPGLDDTDTFGRLLRYVFVDGRNANVDLVRAGAAAPYFYRGNEGVYALELVDAVKDARKDGAGMWGECKVDWSQDRQVDTHQR